MTLDDRCGNLLVQLERAEREELATWCKHPAFKHNKESVQAPLVQRIGEGHLVLACVLANTNANGRSMQCEEGV
eukprot:1735970-Amphidinium_carterae.1